jgi:hypothetical protein
MFQNQVYINPAQGVPGDFASSNPMVYKLSSTGRMVAGAAGVLVGQFCVLNADGTCTSVPGAAPSSTSRIGFVHRENNAQIVTYLAESGYTIQPGEPVAAFGTGDWYVNADAITGTPTRGAAVLWDTTTGKINIGATATATLIATGYVMISESAVANQLVIISNTGA